MPKPRTACELVPSTPMRGRGLCLDPPGGGATRAPRGSMMRAGAEGALAAGAQGPHRAGLAGLGRDEDIDHGVARPVRTVGPPLYGLLTPRPRDALGVPGHAEARAAIAGLPPRLPGDSWSLWTGPTISMPCSRWAPTSRFADRRPAPANCPWASGRAAPRRRDAPRVLRHPGEEPAPSRRGW